MQWNPWPALFLRLDDVSWSISARHITRGTFPVYLTNSCTASIFFQSFSFNETLTE